MVTATSDTYNQQADHSPVEVTLEEVHLDTKKPNDQKSSDSGANQQHVPCTNNYKPYNGNQFKAIRWLANYPLQKRIPCFPVTYGEVLLCLPWVIFLLIGILKTFSNPSIDGSGNVAGYPLLMCFLTANRANSVFSFVLGVPFERMLIYHKLSGYVAFVLGAFHTYVAYAVEDAGSLDRLLYDGDSVDHDSSNQRFLSSSGDGGSGSGDGGQYALYGPDPDFVKFAMAGGTNFSGSAIMVFYAAMIVTSYILVRRLAFEFFYFLHIVFAIMVVYYAVQHSVGNVAFVAFWWALDIAIRMIFTVGIRNKQQKASIKMVPGSNIVEISFPKPDKFHYSAGEYMFLCIPKLSIFQWHPITISSSPHQKMVTFHIKALGGWSKSLLKLTETTQYVTLLMEGPYGMPSIDLDSDRYKLVLFVAGGVGVTPMASMCNDLLYKASIGRDIRKIGFIWSCRTNKECFSDVEGSTANQQVAFPMPSSFAPNLVERPRVGDMVVAGPDTKYTNDGLLFMENYLTGASNDVVNANVTTIAAGFNHGRPDFDTIFRKMKKTAKLMGEKRVAVCVCGPVAMVDACNSVAIRQSSRSVCFDVHSELFEF